MILSNVYASLKDDTTKMNDKMKQKIRTEKVNIQATDPKANASVFLFYPTLHFLKTNAEHSLSPLKEKLSQRVILASPSRKLSGAHLALPETQANPSQS